MNNPGQNSAPSLTGGNPEEVINLPCPNCGQILNLRRKHLGIRGKCVHCHNGVTAVLNSVGAATLVADLPEKHEEPEEAPATSSHAFAPASTSPTAPEPEAAAGSWGQPAPAPQVEEAMTSPEPVHEPEESFQNQSPAPFSGTNPGSPAPSAEETDPTTKAPSETESFGATAPGFLSPAAPANEMLENSPAAATSPSPFGQIPSATEESKPETTTETASKFPSTDFSGTPTPTEPANPADAPAFGGGFAAPAPSPEPESKAFGAPASQPSEEPASTPFSGGFTAPAQESTEIPVAAPKAEEVPQPSFTGGFTQAAAPAETPSSPFGAPAAEEAKPEPEPVPSSESTPEESNSFASGFSAPTSSPPAAASPFGAPPEEQVFADEPATGVDPDPASEVASDSNDSSGFSGGFLAAKPAKDTVAEEPTAETPPSPAFAETPAPSPFGSPSDESKPTASPFSPPQASAPPEIPAEPAPEPKQEPVTPKAESLPGTTAGFISPPPIPAEAISEPEAGANEPALKEEQSKGSPFEEKREKFTPTDPPAGLSPFTTGSASKSQPGFAEALFDKKEEEKPTAVPPKQPAMPSTEAVAASAADQQWGPNPAEKKDLEAMAAVTETATKASHESQGEDASNKPSRMVLKGKGNASGSILKLAKTFILSVILAGIGFAAYKFTPEEKWLEWKDKAVEWLEPGAVILQDTPFAKPAEQAAIENPAAAPEQEEGPSEEEPDTFRVE